MYRIPGTRFSKILKIISTNLFVLTLKELTASSVPWTFFMEA
jgi:hypothetical protein